MNTAIGQGAFTSSATPIHRVGTLGVSPDGRQYRYVKAGLAALVVGNAIQSRAEDVDHDDIAVVSGAVGSRALVITTGASGGALDANEYAGGYAVIDTTPGVGYAYRIDSHAAIAAATNGTINLAAENPIQVVLSTASKVTLVANPYDGVIQHPVTAATGICVGGCIYPIAAGQYGWVQSGGVGAALIAGTPAVGQPLTSVGTPAGALTVHSAELNEVAFMLVTGRAGKVCPVFWTVDG